MTTEVFPVLHSQRLKLTSDVRISWTEKELTEINQLLYRNAFWSLLKQLFISDWWMQISIKYYHSPDLTVPCTVYRPTCSAGRKCLRANVNFVFLFSFASVYSYEYNKGQSSVLRDNSAYWRATKLTPPCSKSKLNWLCGHLVFAEKTGSRAGLHLSAAVFCYTGLGVTWNCTFREK